MCIRTSGVWANIPPRCHRNDPICFSPYLYRARNLIERFFNKIKQSRRVATRYDKLAANYLAFIQLASILRVPYRKRGKPYDGVARRAKQLSENGVGYAEKILKAQHFNLAMSTLTVHCSAIDLTARVKSGSRSKS